MKLGRLLTEHQKQLETNSLANNFGDGYLYAQNLIFRNIRTAVLKQNFSFSSKHSPLYLALPLSQLEIFLSEKIIPYFDNVSVIQQIHQKLPENLAWDDISDNLKGNHVFHESCHAIARAVTTGTAKDLTLQAKNDPEKMILLRMFEESFANTCELLAVTDAGDAVHRIFFELNSYVCMFEDRTQLKTAMKDLGAAGFMKWMWLCYLQANFLKPFFNESSFDKLIYFCFAEKITPAQKKTLRALSKIAFELNLRFREVTTSFYLRLNGISRPFPQVLQFDAFQKLEKAPDLIKAMDELIQIALQGF